MMRSYQDRRTGIDRRKGQDITVNIERRISDRRKSVEKRGKWEMVEGHNKTSVPNFV